MNTTSDLYMSSTRTAYVMTRVLDTPFWSIFNLLPFILYKDLHATPFQLGLVITLKPLVSILSSYWSARLYREPNRLGPSITLARWLAYLPFFLFPFVHNVWYIIACFGLFMFLQTGMMPAWMELLKQNIPTTTRDKVFSYTQVFGYLGGGLMPFALGWILDEWLGAWRWMFPIAAMIALCASIWQYRIMTKPAESPPPIPERSHPLIQPWKRAWELLRQHPSFAKFQVGFMFIGGGLMIIQPGLPIFFVDHLHLSYTEMGVAITLCKGIGFAASSPIWVRWIQKVNLFYFGALIATLAVIFPLLLIMAQLQIAWLFMAYLINGVMQAGSEMSWNLSGPMFAKQEDSSPFSSVNVMAVGVRGAFIPSFGALLLTEYGSSPVILLSASLCLLAALWMAACGRDLKRATNVVA